MIAYIDGFNLYYGLRQKGWKRCYWLNLKALIQNLLLPDQHLIRVKYFTSRVSSSPSDPDKSRRQSTYLEALETLTDSHIYYGHYLSSRVITCRNCGAEWADPKEKMTDVNIAVEMLTDAFQNAFNTALVVSADSDLSAPIERVSHLFPGKRVVVAFPPARNSARLRRVATSCFTIGRGKLAARLFPDQVVKSDGYVLRRPESWR